MSTIQKENKRTKNKKHLALKVISIILCIVIVMTGIISVCLYNFAFNVSSPIHMTKVIPNNMVIDENLTYSGEVGTVNVENWFKENRQDVYMTTDDNLKLHAYYCESIEESNKYVIACHGYTSKAADMGVYAMHFADKGFSVLMPDARAHGESDGKIIGMGWPERFDLLKWINMIIENDPQAQIILYGISMGAATVMMTSGESMPENVIAVIEDCGYSSVFDELKWQANSMGHVPDFPLVYTVSLLNEMKSGFSLKEASAVEQVKKSTTPTLFIHGSEDWLVPFDMLDKVYEAANCEKEKLVVEGAGHAASSSTDPELYWSTIFDFISAYTK
ncbi:MAG: alpha/beta hydrolase [Acetobacter sp.]|nr:alpha/beta hydrolase [Bacteroides sp.]MCM1340642.1 alpha/beta hydrolase [Acetobacter sp.]MCM1433753.1 alpha/beta hydrolase [Clostridiales bacterium]